MAAGEAPVTGAPEAAAAALASLLEAGEPWPPPDPLRLRNRLLDACGSDHRPLVELLLRVGRHGMVDALRTLGPTPAAAWPAHRTRLVSRAVGALYIQPDMAAWAVDAWAVALGVVPGSAVASLQREYAERERQVVAERERAEAATLAVARATRGGARPGRGTPAGAAGVAGGWTSAPASGRVGAWRPGKVAPGAPPRWRVSSAPPPPNTARFLGVLALGFVGLMALIGGMRLLTPASPGGRSFVRLPASAGAEDPWAELEPNGPGIPPGTVGGAIPGTAANAAAGTVGGAIPGTAASAAAGAIGGATGATTVGDAGDAAATAAAPARTVSPESTAPVSGTPAPTMPAPVDPTADWPEDPVARGVAGRYAVVHTVHSVAGGDLCRPVEEALLVAQRASEEEIVHAPGALRFELASRPGVVGRVYPGGAFETVTHRGEHDGVRYVFRMTGRFTPEGFVARTVTQTEALLTYRQLQRCAVMAELTGTRLPAP
jgi:hypothetical protein